MEFHLKSTGYDGVIPVSVKVNIPMAVTFTLKSDIIMKIESPLLWKVRTKNEQEVPR